MNKEQLDSLLANIESVERYLNKKADSEQVFWGHELDALTACRKLQTWAVYQLKGLES